MTEQQSLNSISVILRLKVGNATFSERTLKYKTWDFPSKMFNYLRLFRNNNLYESPIVSPDQPLNCGLYQIQTSSYTIVHTKSLEISGWIFFAKVRCLIELNYIHSIFCLLIVRLNSPPSRRSDLTQTFLMFLSFSLFIVTNMNILEIIF